MGLIFTDLTFLPVMRGLESPKSRTWRSYLLPQVLPNISHPLCGASLLRQYALDVQLFVAGQLDMFDGQSRLHKVDRSVPIADRVGN